MFFHLARFEFSYFRRQPSFYVTLLIFFLLSFFAMISENVQIGGGSNIDFNSPYAIAQTMILMSIVGMFLVANFVGGTGVRDVAHKMDAIMLTLPISKSAYLWGRLLGAYLFCLVVFSMVPLGTLIGSFWPTVDSERLGDTKLWAYGWIYLVFIIPNFLFCSVLFYLLALKARSMMGMYLGVVAFFILYSISQQMLDDPTLAQWASMLDPFGFSAFLEATKYWTPFELNHRFVTLDSGLLINRVIWLSVTLLLLIGGQLLIDLRREPKLKAQRSARKQAAPAIEKIIPVQPDDSASAEWRRFFARVKFEILQIIKSAPFIILCLIAFFSLTTLFFNKDGLYGTANWPLTRTMAFYIIGAFQLMVLVVITYYSAEIVWRERQLGMGEIVESTPIRNWSLYFPKLIALVVIVTSLMLVGMTFTVPYQTLKGWTHYEWDVYAILLSTGFIAPMVMNAVMAIFIQVLSPNKYTGMLFFIAFFIANIVLAKIGLEHQMFHFARTPLLLYSDINQYGHFLVTKLWYLLYWLGFTIMLAVAGFALWPRGSEYSLKYRLSMMRRNMGGAGAFIMALGLFVFIASGGYIFYNTNILNDYLPHDDLLDIKADYEKQYKQYDSMDLPTITDVYAEVAIYPQQRRLTAKGHYLLKNNNAQALKKTLLMWDQRRHRSLKLKLKGGRESGRDEKFGAVWLTFEPPLPPGASTRLDFEFTRANKGFVDHDAETRIVANGSFVNSAEIFPHFGYQKSLEITDRHERRKRDLPPPQRMAKLEDHSHYGTNFLGREADYINFDTIVSTRADQIAISPGYLQKQWVKDGRRYFHYKMDAPIFNFVAYLSGKYDITRDTYKGIRIEVYHHPRHNKNVGRMIQAVKDSLDYYSEQFSPYQHRQVRIIEFPRYARFAQSFSNTIPYSEDIGFIADLRDKDAIDYVYFVTAHEMAHQWWGHQLMPADVQGSAVLSETLAQYSAYMVMEKSIGKDQLRKFLKWEMDRYLSGRSSEVLEEMPLYRAEDQQYIHYQKGGVVMYSIRDRIGEKAVNTALRKLLKKFQYAANPYPTTLDLLEFLKAQAPNEKDRKFIDELFTTITLFDLKMKSAKATPLANGHYRVELEIEARKYHADGQGKEHEVELQDKFDIGVFAKDPDKATGSDHVLYFQKRSLKSGINKIELEVDKKPLYAGVDPYIKMIDRNSDDNLKPIALQSGEQ